MLSNQEIVLSAIKPTSIPHLGNYLGAISHWVKLQADKRCYFFIVDLHALTVPQDPVLLKQRTYQALAFYLACGLDPKKSTIFCQSHVPEHAELAWILNCFTYTGELSRMTQYKEKSQKLDSSSIGAGLFNYPVLMAADILLYKPHKIPVGDDQKQHVELTRNIAERLNNRFQKPVFVVPTPVIPETAHRIMDLQEPTNKMSKSTDNAKGILYLSDSDQEITKKIKSAMTDSGSEISYDEEKKGLKNLIEIYSALSHQSPEQVVKAFEGKMYGHLKAATAELAVSVLGPIRTEAERLLKDEDYLNAILKQAGAAEASKTAAATLKEVYDCLGLIPK